MNVEPMFVPEQLYNRKRDVHARFGGQEQGGMITPARYLILLVTGNSGRVHGCADHWSEDRLRFFYFGEGQSGDMKFTKGNLALRDHVSGGEDVHLFEEVPEKSVYLRYKGQMVCIGFTLADAPDNERNMRKAILFELVPLHAFQTTAEAPAPESSTAETEEEWSRASLDELRRKVVANSAEFRTPVERRALYRMRSRAVRLYVLRRANGVCEGFRNPAPFVTSASIPYLEPHHIRRLTDGGPDNPTWVVAVCPNSHRRAH
ncbi:MAG TPA: HNH endonuclease signature motif containing protein [Candidatus Acidoferrales bacterium]